MMRIVIFKKDLLFPLWIYPVHVVLLGLSALVGGVLIFWKRRVTVVSLADTLKKKGQRSQCRVDPGDVPHLDIFTWASD